MKTKLQNKRYIGARFYADRRVYRQARAKPPHPQRITKNNTENADTARDQARFLRGRGGVALDLSAEIDEYRWARAFLYRLL
jgi:hypothetical protein